MLFVIILLPLHVMTSAMGIIYVTGLTNQRLGVVVASALGRVMNPLVSPKLFMKCLCFENLTFYVYELLRFC